MSNTEQPPKIVAYHECVNCELEEMTRSAAEYHVDMSGHQTEPVYL